MKKRFLTAVLTLASVLALSQSAAFAKSHKHNAKTHSAQAHHKKHM